MPRARACRAGRRRHDDRRDAACRGEGVAARGCRARRCMGVRAGALSGADVGAAVRRAIARHVPSPRPVSAMRSSPRCRRKHRRAHPMVMQERAETGGAVAVAGDQEFVQATSSAATPSAAPVIRAQLRALRRPAPARRTSAHTARPARPGPCRRTGSRSTSRRRAGRPRGRPSRTRCRRRSPRRCWRRTAPTPPAGTSPRIAANAIGMPQPNAMPRYTCGR